MTVVAVLMAAHNRRDGTVASLRALRGGLSGTPYRVYLVDDGSTDGTTEAVKYLFAEVSVISGDGELYWAASMSLAERHAIRAPYEYLLWLNDDTDLVAGAIDRLVELSKRRPDAIIVGATVDPASGRTTYGARRRVDSHPQRFELLAVSDEVQEADNFNGNCVLVPASVRERLGPIDGGFPHAFADDDYGQRAMTAGVPILQAPSFVGFCSRNAPITIPRRLADRWRYYESPKGLPWRAQFRYLRRHGDAMWPLWFAGSFVHRMMGRKVN